MAYVKFEGKQYPLLPKETVLQALLRGGATLPSSCRKGSCQTCLMRLARGQVKQTAGNRLHPALSATGHFLPCVATSAQDLDVERPHLIPQEMRMRVSGKRVLAGGIVQLRLAPEAVLTWRAGQHVELRSPAGAYRRYSIASCLPGDRLLELHIELQPGGEVSSWLCNEVSVGDLLWGRPPEGSCHYDRTLKTRPLLLIGSGTGLAPLLGIVRTALRDGHEGSICLYHEAGSLSQLYGREVLAELADVGQLQFFECVSQVGAMRAGVFAGRASTLAFDAHPELSGYAVFIAGHPEAVDATRVEAVRRGASRHWLFAEPFDSDVLFPAGDQPKRVPFEPDLELWQALGSGKELRVLLEQFYAKASQDPLLKSLYKNVVLEHVVSEQCAFLEAAFCGGPGALGTAAFSAEVRTYPFPARPIGAPAPVISNELFDHRESLFEACLRQAALPEAMIRRWCAFNEIFRRQTVKPSAQSLKLDIAEQRL